MNTITKSKTKQAANIASTKAYKRPRDESESQGEGNKRAREDQTVKVKVANLTKTSSPIPEVPTESMNTIVKTKRTSRSVSKTPVNNNPNASCALNGHNKLLSSMPEDVVKKISEVGGFLYEALQQPELQKRATLMAASKLVMQNHPDLLEVMLQTCTFKKLSMRAACDEILKKVCVGVVAEDVTEGVNVDETALEACVRILCRYCSTSHPKQHNSTWMTSNKHKLKIIEDVVKQEGCITYSPYCYKKN